MDVSTNELLFSRIFAEEVLENDNAFFCEKCQKRVVQAVKSYSLVSLSNTLILTANRFCYDKELKRKIKKLNQIKYASTIVVPERVLELGDKCKYNSADCEYELYAIVIHSVLFLSARPSVGNVE